MSMPKVKVLAQGQGPCLRLLSKVKVIVQGQGHCTRCKLTGEVSLNSTRVYLEQIFSGEQHLNFSFVPQGQR